MYTNKLMMGRPITPERRLFFTMSAKKSPRVWLFSPNRSSRTNVRYLSTAGGDTINPTPHTDQFWAIYTTQLSGVRMPDVQAKWKPQCKCKQVVQDHEHT